MSAINNYLTNLAKNLSVTADEKIKIDKSISYLTGKLWERFQENLLKVEVFGSYDRDTFLSQRVNENSDVDLLVIFKTNDYQPATFLKHLREFADKLYPRSEVSPDHPAITIILDHVKFELVPAFWEKRSFNKQILQIPAPKNAELKWIATDPVDLKNRLLEKDKEENGMIIPLIKIVKYFNILKGQPYDSYIFENFIVEREYPHNEMKDYFFEFINDLQVKNQTELQKKFIHELKTRRENLIALDKRNLENYIEQELQLFLPMVN